MERVPTTIQKKVEEMVDMEVILGVDQGCPWILFQVFVVQYQLEVGGQ